MSPIVIWLSLSGPVVAPAPPMLPPLPELPLAEEMERMRCRQLESLRRGRKLFEENIAMYEMFLRDFARLYTQEQVRSIQQDLDKWREHVRWSKDQERVLWEQQPGGITAPMPREKK